MNSRALPAVADLSTAPNCSVGCNATAGTTDGWANGCLWLQHSMVLSTVSCALPRAALCFVPLQQELRLYHRCFLLIWPISAKSSDGSGPWALLGQPVSAWALACQAAANDTRLQCGRCCALGGATLICCCCTASGISWASEGIWTKYALRQNDDTNGMLGGVSLVFALCLWATSVDGIRYST